jgi:hypothetical protein
MKHRYFRAKIGHERFICDTVTGRGWQVTVAEAVLDEWQAVEVVELPDFVVSRVSDTM